MKEDLQKALSVLKKGGSILYPTDTIWGIGCDATNQEAVSNVYKIKNRKDSKSMIILLDHPNRLLSYIQQVPDVAWELLEVTDKPLTIIYPGAKNLAGNVINENGTIGVRIVKDEFCQKLISAFRKPIVSTSANISGEPGPKIFDDISTEIKEHVDYIVKWRQKESKPALPSSIIKLGVNGDVEIIRK